MATTNSQKKTRSKAKQSPLWDDHYAVTAYKEVFGRLSARQKELLVQRVTECHISPRAWRDALENWKLCGYSPLNLAGMIEYAIARPGGNVGPTVIRREVEVEAEPIVGTVAIRQKEHLFDWMPP